MVLHSPDVLAAMTANMRAFWWPYGSATSAQRNDEDGVTWFHSGLPSPLFNGVLEANSDEAGVRRAAEALQQQLSLSRTQALWWIGPDARPMHMGRLLADLGLRPGGSVPGMIMDLSKLPEQVAPITGLAVRKVRDTSMRRLWAQVVGEASGFAGALANLLAELETTISDPTYAVQHRYIAYLYDVPVGTAAMVTDHGVAGLYAISTREEARGRGIGTALTLLPLLEARRRGHTIATLQASPLGYPIYKRLGFDEVCRYQHYVQG